MSEPKSIHLLRYSEGLDRDHEGYTWLELPNVPPQDLAGLFGGPFRGETHAQVLTCDNCGALVAFPDRHAAWHRSLSSE